MVNALALEAATDSCSVTLHASGTHQSVVVDEARSHSKHFLPLIHSLLQQQQLALADLDFIACGNGPGSFTGLRICFGVAQGLAFGLNLPLLTVSSLESMAFGFHKDKGDIQGRVFTLLDAHMGEMYIEEFKLAKGAVHSVGGADLLSLVEVESRLAQINKNSTDQCYLLGNGAKLLTLPGDMQNRYVVYDQIQPQSAAVAEIALAQWAAGKITAAADAEIGYLRNSVSWDKRKRIRTPSKL